MSDKEIGRRFRQLVIDQGAYPLQHRIVVAKLKQLWPRMWALIKEVEAQR